MRVTLFAVVAVLLVAAPAPAHERRAVGTVETVVGWLNEPALAGSVNAVSFRATRSGAGVTGAALKADVSSAGETMTLTMEPVFRDPGHYRADLIPTRPGAYTFRIYGRLAGRSFDQTFVSGDATFDEVTATADLEFPARDPSRDELASRLVRQEARIDALRARASAADRSAFRALLLGGAAALLGLAALVLAIRRKPAA